VRTTTGRRNGGEVSVALPRVAIVALVSAAVALSTASALTQVEKTVRVQLPPTDESRQVPGLEAFLKELRSIASRRNVNSLLDILTPISSPTRSGQVAQLAAPHSASTGNSTVLPASSGLISSTFSIRAGRWRAAVPAMMDAPSGIRTGSSARLTAWTYFPSTQLCGIGTYRCTSNREAHRRSSRDSRTRWCRRWQLPSRSVGRAGWGLPCSTDAPGSSAKMSSTDSRVCGYRLFVEPTRRG